VNNVLLIGDSFAAPTWPDHTKYNTHTKDRVIDFAWPTRLAAQHNVTNFALQGSGPDYSLTRLREWVRDHSAEEVAGTDLIFVCSAPERLDLNCYKHPYEQVHIYDIAKGDIRHKAKMFAKWAIEWYFTLDWAMNRELMYYSTAVLFASQFKSVLYWPLTGNQLRQWRVQHPHNFSMPTDPLVPLSAKDDASYDGGADTRPNHFNERNHNIIFEQLNSWLKDSTPLDTSQIR
jgi:hypothetical protein